MELEEAIGTRRTHKAYRPEPVDRALLEELLDLARWAPNHNLTNPWRFRVIGPASLERLKKAAGPEAATKLDRAPTLVVCSCALGDDPIQNEEDLTPPPAPPTSSSLSPTAGASRATGARPRCCGRPRVGPRSESRTVNASSA
jgi:nitroreductase